MTYIKDWSPEGEKLSNELIKGYFWQNHVRDFHKKHRAEIRALPFIEQKALKEIADECLEELEFCPPLLIEPPGGY